MKTRSSHNWNENNRPKDVLNTSFLDFNGDWPILNCPQIDVDFSLCWCNDYKNIHSDSLVVSFLDDNRLERFWNNPIKYTKIFKQAKYVMSPDFSLLVGMPKAMQMWNTYRNRLVGYVWQQAGLSVIPTVSWSDISSFDYCFSGIAKGSVISVSAYGIKERGARNLFNTGLSELYERISPNVVILQCHRTHRGFFKNDNILFIDTFFEHRKIKNKWAEGLDNQQTLGAHLKERVTGSQILLNFQDLPQP